MDDTSSIPKTSALAGGTDDATEPSPGSVGGVLPFPEPAERTKRTSHRTRGIASIADAAMAYASRVDRLYSASAELNPWTNDMAELQALLDRQTAIALDAEVAEMARDAATTSVATAAIDLNNTIEEQMHAVWDPPSALSLVNDTARMDLSRCLEAVTTPATSGVLQMVEDTRSVIVRDAIAGLESGFADVAMGVVPDVDRLASDWLSVEAVGIAAAAQELSFDVLAGTRALDLSALTGAGTLGVAEQIGSYTAGFDLLGPSADVLSELSRLADFGNALVSWPASFPRPPEVAPGSFYDDLSLLQDPRRESEAKLAALDRMADRFRWVRYRPRVRRALDRRARETDTRPAIVLRDEVRAAVVLALGTSGQPQLIRFGADWVRDDRGKVTAVAPDQLPVDWYFDWFRIAVARQVERSLQERPDRVPTLESRPLKEPEAGVVALPAGWEDLRPAPPEDDPLVLLVEREEHDEARQQLAACLNLATPRQRAILRLLHQGLSREEAAQRLGITESTVRVQLKRLRDRVRASALAA